MRRICSVNAVLHSSQVLHGYLTNQYPLVKYVLLEETWMKVEMVEWWQRFFIRGVTSKAE